MSTSILQVVMWTAVNHFREGILAWVLGDHSAETFKPLSEIVCCWQCYFYVTDGWKVYASFIEPGDHIVRQRAALRNALLSAELKLV